MSRPYTIHEDDHSEKAEMIREAFDVAFNGCYFCEVKVATTTCLGEPACEECASQDIRTSLPLYKMSDKQKAVQLKIAINLFKKSHDEDKIIKESTDPQELMNWLWNRATQTNFRDGFIIDYDNFINRWKEVFGNTDDIPQSFKDKVNTSYRMMRGVYSDPTE